MTGNPYRNAAQDPEVMARNAKDQQQASPEAIERYKASFEASEHTQAVIDRNNLAYKQARQQATIEREQREIEDFDYLFKTGRPRVYSNMPFILKSCRALFELAAVVGGLAAIVAVLIVISAMM
jgi:hypothetical protein